MNEELTSKQDPHEGQEELRGEEREAALPEGRAGGRRGETGCQLIRRAKQASLRRFPAEEKIRIVMEEIRAEVSVADLCRRDPQGHCSFCPILPLVCRDSGAGVLA